MENDLNKFYNLQFEYTVDKKFHETLINSIKLLFICYLHKIKTGSINILPVYYNIF